MYKDISDTKTVTKDKSSDTELYASSQTVALATDTKEEDNPSPHSGYPCVIGCGDKGYTPSDSSFYYNFEINKDKSLIQYYKTINVEPSKAKFNTQGNR